MINGILFSIIVMLLVYMLIKYFGVWIGCIGSLVYFMVIIFIPILAFLLLIGVFAELVEILINTFVQFFT